MATTLATVESREVLRCERCQLVQFRTQHGNCRRCLKAMEPEEQPLPPLVPQSAEPATSQELNVARAVRTLRHGRGLSQRQLAARMMVPRTYISKIENGKAMPTLASLERLATALDAHMTELVHDAQSRRVQVVTAVVADTFLAELLPLSGRLNAFQQQILVSHARDMARDASSGRQLVARA